MKNIENFDDLVNVVGLALAIILCFDRLPESYFSSLKFNQWIEIYKDIKMLSWYKLKKTAEEKILELAQTLEEWCSVYSYVPEKSHIAMKKIREMDLDFEQCFWLHDHSYFGSNLRQLALERMVKLAETLEQWVDVHNKACNYTDIKKDAFNKILELSSSIPTP